MTIRVRLFARARDLAGVDFLDLEIPPDATVGHLRRRLVEERPALASIIGRSAIAVDADFAGDDRALAGRSEAALIPPVSGG